MLTQSLRNSKRAILAPSRAFAQTQFIVPQQRILQAQAPIMARQFSKVASISQDQQYKSNSSQGRSFMNLMLPIMGLTYMLSQYNQKSNECAKASVAQTNRGNEDNKIRFYGTPQEIFKHFGSCDGDDGNLEMSYSEFLKALTAFNYSTPKAYKNYFAKYEDTVNSILHIADVDKNGQISFTEFFFFVLMMQTTSKSIKSEFKKTGGKMNMKQFSTYLTKQRRKGNFGKKMSMLKSTDEEFISTNQIMTKNIFGGKTEITEEEYIHFKHTIQELMWHYEFHQFDVDDNHCISGHDFAMSLIIYFPFNQFQTYVKHLDESEHQGFHHDKITLNEFIAFQYFLRARQLIIDQVMANGQIDMEGLELIADEFAETHEFMQRTGTKLSKKQLHAFLATLDLDGNLVLDVEEVIGILNKKKEIGGGILMTKKKR